MTAERTIIPVNVLNEMANYGLNRQSFLRMQLQYPLQHVSAEANRERKVSVIHQSRDQTRGEGPLFKFIKWRRQELFGTVYRTRNMLRKRLAKTMLSIQCHEGIIRRLKRSLPPQSPALRTADVRSVRYYAEEMHHLAGSD